MTDSGIRSVLPQKYQQPHPSGTWTPNYSGTRIVGGRMLGGDTRFLGQLQEEEKWNPLGVRAYVNDLYRDMEQRSIDDEVSRMVFGWCG